ncbi:MAG TPA: NUDIX domain-containing protein [Candidatus Woesearchaeota archaeon]|nr:MAG: hypothetical protein DRJ25_03190 [Candidatus Woesearchaeota archaeon]HDD70768.1 NUDIX domain-containing protein [Candidatus Woesearchaeota archaeon]
MKSNTTLAKKEREDIFKLFIKKRMLKFNEIEKSLELKSNTLSYHLDMMIKDGLLEKDDEYYKLTKKAEQMLPFFAHLTGRETGPLTVIVAAVKHKNKICLLRRVKRPYQGYWGMIGGKLKMKESIKDCAIREAKEETGLDCEFKGVRGVLHERVKEGDEIKHAFVIFLCELESKSEEFTSGEEGQLAWFNLDELPAKIIPSDGLMIKEMLQEGISYKEVIMEDDGTGELTGMKVNQ